MITAPILSLVVGIGQWYSAQCTVSILNTPLSFSRFYSSNCHRFLCLREESPDPPFYQGDDLSRDDSIYEYLLYRRHHLLPYQCRWIRQSPQDVPRRYGDIRRICHSLHDNLLYTDWNECVRHVLFTYLGWEVFVCPLVVYCCNGTTFLITPNDTDEVFIHGRYLPRHS